MAPVWKPNELFSTKIQNCEDAARFFLLVAICEIVNLENIPFESVSDRCG